MICLTRYIKELKNEEKKLKRKLKKAENQASKDKTDIRELEEEANILNEANRNKQQMMRK
ncbi:17004_t:CDS:1, partial [Gigaspora rosea]